MATDRQKAYALIGLYKKKYKQVFGADPPGLNRHALSHGFESLVVDYPHHANQIVEYYVENYSNPLPVWLTYNYEKVLESIQESERDEDDRRRIREKTKERMRNVINSRKSDQGGN